MRDIRKDLEERIQSLQSRRELLQYQLEQLKEKENTLKALLKQEEKEWMARQPAFLDLGERPPVKTHSELSKFLLTTLSDGNPHSTGELVALAQSQSIPIKGKSHRRAIHFALVGMKQNNLVEMVRSRVWKIAGKASGKTEP